MNGLAAYLWKISLVATEFPRVLPGEPSTVSYFEDSNSEQQVSLLSVKRYVRATKDVLAFSNANLF